MATEENKQPKEPCEVIRLVFKASELKYDGKEYLANNGQLTAKYIDGEKILFFPKKRVKKAS